MSQVITDETPEVLEAAPQDVARDARERVLSILGVDVTDVSKPHAFELMEEMLRENDGRCRSLYLVNAHTLNEATDDPRYRDVLNSADYVFNDGTGVRWAARQRGYELRDNLCGTDLVPEFLQATADRGYRYFLLVAARDTILGAAGYARARFPGWTLAGYHDGYVHADGSDAVVEQINAAEVDLLLVGMGNPVQEQWILRNKPRLDVRLAIGVGGLFDHWVDKLRRALCGCAVPAANGCTSCCCNRTSGAATSWAIPNSSTA